MVPFVLTSGGCCWGTWCLDHAAGFDALGAGLDSTWNAIHENPRGLQVGVPAAIRFIIRLADVVTRRRAFTANIANACHCLIYHLFCERKTRVQGSAAGRHLQGHEGDMRWQQP